MRFTCSSCGKEHELDEISFGADRPLQWDSLTLNEKRNSTLGDEQCIINNSQGRSYYVRACLDIPIQNTGKIFSWGVWTSLSDKSFLDISEHWDNPDRIHLRPYFGWLCTRIPHYPDTMFLKTMVHNRPLGQRPTVLLEPTDHPLSLHQRNGIPADELQQIITTLLHCPS